MRTHAIFNHNWQLAASALAAMLFLIGCGGSDVDGPPPLAPVSGTITDGDQPVANAMVEFFPTAGRTSVGQTDAEGKYTLKYSDLSGAVIGPCRVQITPGGSMSSGDVQDDVVAAPMKAPQPIVRVKEQVTVKEGENTFDFNLADYRTKKRRR